MTKPKAITPFDYEALKALTGPALIENIRSECDSESLGYLNAIERFEIDEPHPNAKFRFYQVNILSRSRHVDSKSSGTLTCHYFAVDNNKPNYVTHFEFPYFLVDNFNKLCKGFKDD
jgi:hypothetical protein